MAERGRSIRMGMAAQRYICKKTEFMLSLKKKHNTLWENDSEHKQHAFYYYTISSNYCTNFENEAL